MGEPRTALILLMIMCFAVASILEIGIVNANDTIYIRIDGSVEGTEKIQRDGNTYTFTDNIYGSIVVEKNNIVIDGAYYTLQGSRIGLDLSGRDNVTIKKIEIRDLITAFTLMAPTILKDLHT